MILSKYEITKYITENHLKIEPFSWKYVHGIGIDLRVSNEIFRLRRNDLVLDTHSPHNLRHYYVEEIAKSFVINPDEHILACTMERIELPTDLAGLVHLRSTFARLGLSLSLGLVSPGFEGAINLGNNGRKLSSESLCRRRCFLHTLSQVGL